MEICERFSEQNKKQKNKIKQDKHKHFQLERSAVCLCYLTSGEQHRKLASHIHTSFSNATVLYGQVSA